MSFELPNPADRTAVDFMFPVITRPSGEWLPYTEFLAVDLINTAYNLALMHHMEAPMPDNYEITVTLEKPHQEVPFALPHSFQDLADPELLFGNSGPANYYRVMLRPKRTANVNRPVAILEKQDESLQLIAMDEPISINFRDTKFNVRHSRSWRLWNNHLDMRLRGFSDEEYADDYWQPDYEEQFRIVDGAFAGQDLYALVVEFDQEIADIEHGFFETGGFSYLQSDERRTVTSHIYRAVRGEIAEATGITMHTTTGYTALNEASQVLASIKNFIKQA